MIESEMQKNAAKIYFELLNKGYLSCESPLAIKYFDNDEIRNYVRNLAISSGVTIIKREKYIHMLANPNSCIFSTSLTELKKNVRSIDSRVDLYLMGVIWMVLFSKVDTEMSTSIKWENEGVKYEEIEAETNKVLDSWNKIDELSKGKFSTEWSLAIKDMYSKWRILPYSNIVSGKRRYKKNTRLGLIDSAMKELEKNKLIFIRLIGHTTIVTPNIVFYERLQAAFGNLGRYKDRYDKLKVLIEDIRNGKEGEIIYGM